MDNIIGFYKFRLAIIHSRCPKSNEEIGKINGKIQMNYFGY